MLGGANRTIIKLAQQLVVNQKTKLGEHDVGALVTISMAYDLLESIIPGAWQAEIEQVASRHGETALPTRVTKVIALVTGVPSLRLDGPNIAALLHPSVDAESLREPVSDALQSLVAEEVLRQTEDGYKLQSPEEKDWEKERRGLDMRLAEFGRIRRGVFRELLAGLVASSGRTFKVEVIVDDERVLEGEIPLAFLEADQTELDDVRARSRDSNAEATLFWTYRPSAETQEAALEVYRSAEMVKRKEAASKSGGEVELLGEERARLTRAEKLLADRLTEDVMNGSQFFRGLLDDPRGKDLRTAAREAVEARITEIYPRLAEFSAPVKRGDALTVLHADTLDGLPDYLREDGLGLVRITHDGVVVVTDQDPVLAVLQEINERATYGREASGKYLEEKFGKPPFGATVEVVQVLVAAGLRAGVVEVIHQGARIAKPKDPRLDKVFSALPSFRASTFGASRWIGSRSTSSSIGSPRSIGSPSRLKIRPSVTWPTGTVIGAPVSITSVPRLRPSVVSIATARTRSSPRCCWTSQISMSSPCAAMSATAFAQASIAA